MSPRPQDEAGFSLLELLVAGTVMLAIIGGALSLTYQTQANSSDRAGETAARQMARVASWRLTTDVRLIGYGAGTLEPLQTAAPRLLDFVADVDDGDPAVPCTNETRLLPRPERIVYELQDDGSFRRGIQCRNGNNTAWVGTLQWTTVAEGIDTDTVLFRYFDAAGNELGSGGAALTATEREKVRNVAVDLPLVLPDTERLIGVDDRIRFDGGHRVLLRNLALSDS